MRWLTWLIVCMVAAPVAGAAQAAAPTDPAAAARAAGLEIPLDMRPYYLVLLTKGPKWASNEPMAPELLKQHLAYIHRMVNEGKYVVAGPMTDDGPTVGMAIMAASSLEEANRIVSGDPTVQAGQCGYELHPALLPSLADFKIRY